MGKSVIYSLIYQTVNRVPRGKVATYGQIARLAGIAGHARQVGYALHRLPDGSSISWHRIINRKGQISLQSDMLARSLQRALLESEGVVFDKNDTVALKKYQWRR
jgi:methylated-DNA-protein-cysteine methyltransferase-like protein